MSNLTRTDHPRKLPHHGAQVKPLIERALKQKLPEAFFRFEEEALASASIAQVGFCCVGERVEDSWWPYRLRMWWSVWGC